MLENIALIEEIHQNKTIQEAQDKAISLLKLISLEHIAHKRVNLCTPTEIFWVMFLRAYLFNAKTIIVQFIFSITYEINTIEEIIETLQKLNITKNIIFVDIKTNQHLYCFLTNTKEQNAL